MKAIVLALAAALAACGGGGSHHSPMDAGMTPDAPPDGPPAATFTSYVLDLVQHQTANDTAPRPYSEFQALPDPDQNNGSAYSPLFP